MFFLDRCLGRNIVSEALRQAGCRVELHDDHFDQDTPDQDWLPQVGGRGWVLLTQDKAIRKNQLEVTQILKSSLAAFILTGGSMKGEEMAKAFVTALPTVRRFLKKFNRPFIATVSASGTVSLVQTYSQIARRVL
ncbi:MAG: hypothetical protein HYS13_22045 [Planctomycetia bacterium]|nr:hypothetical protein [Planctomycetia bacterium]